MCESDNESENNSSAHISVFEQRAYIKIETIRGKTVPEIHATLNEVCGTDTVDPSMVQRWHQRFRDGRISMITTLALADPLWLLKTTLTQLFSQLYSMKTDE